MKQINLNISFKITITSVVMATCVLISCTPDNTGPDDFIPTETVEGLLRVDFVVPEFNRLPENYIHRANLCVAYTPDSLYRQQYIDCANVSDVQEIYDFKLLPGVYYYQAAITCSAPGDTCLWGAFPGGRMGLKWSITRVVIEKNKTTTSSPLFQ